MNERTTTLLLSLLLLALTHLACCTQDDSCQTLTSKDALLIVDVQNDFMESIPVPTHPEYEIPSDATTDNGTRVREGSLAVKNSKEIIDPIHNWISAMHKANGTVFLSLDWHPKDHCSFCRNGTMSSNPSYYHPHGDLCGPVGQSSAHFNATGRCQDATATRDYSANRMFQWPDHCRQQHFGSRFTPVLAVPQNGSVVMKGFVPVNDSYSAFGGTHCVAGWPFWNSTEDVSSLPGRPSLLDLVRTKQTARLFVVGLATDFCVRMSALDAARHGLDSIVVGSASRPVNQDQMPVVIANLTAANVTFIDDQFVTVSDVLTSLCSSGSDDPKSIAGWIWLSCGAAIAIGTLAFFANRRYGKKPESTTSQAVRQSLVVPA